MTAPKYGSAGLCTQNITTRHTLAGDVKHQAGRRILADRPIGRSVPRSDRSDRCCDKFLYGFKGAPPARHANGQNRQRELARATGESRAVERPVISGKGRRGPAVTERQLSLRPSGGSPTGATSCRARLPRHRPQPVPAVTPRYRATRAGPGRHARAECADRRAKGSQPPGRNAAHCPGRPLQRQGHPKILSNRFAERIFGTRP